jgi:hypothetical protein
MDKPYLDKTTCFEIIKHCINTNVQLLIELNEIKQINGDINKINELTKKIKLVNTILETTDEFMVLS